MFVRRVRFHRIARALVAALAVLLLVRCSDGIHGSATANGSDRNSAGQIRLGLPF